MAFPFFFPFNYLLFLDKPKKEKLHSKFAFNSIGPQNIEKKKKKNTKKKYKESATGSQINQWDPKIFLKFSNI